MRIYSPTKQKILLLLAGGLVLGLRKHTPGQQIKLAKNLAKDWRQIDRQYLYRCLREFRDNRLISYREDQNGDTEIVLNETGKQKILRFDLDKLKIAKPTRWDGKWRVVIYDVPEKLKVGRETLRAKLKELGFHEWQKSVFVHPYPCRDQIDFVAEVFELRNYIRYAELINPTNEAELKLKFKL